MHWHRVKRVLQYLKKTINYGINYCGYPAILVGHTDASWITNSEDHSSTSGWSFMLGGAEVSWESKKQTCITDSTIVAEFVALASSSKKQNS